MKTLYKHDFNEDISAVTSIGAGKIQVAVEFNALKEIEKLQAKLVGKSDLFSKVAGYALDFAKDQVLKQEA